MAKLYWSLPFLFAFLTIDLVFAEQLEVQKVVGEITPKVTPGSLIREGIHFKGAEGSTLVLRSETESIVFKGPFDIALEQHLSSDKANVILLSFGSLRRAIRKQLPKENVIVKTPNAAMGVRGTDFFVSFSKSLGETEAICLQNIVFLKGKKNKVDIKEGFWGGVGGRFGERIRKPFRVKKEIIDGIKASHPL